MSVELSHLMELVKGLKKSLQVGDLPREVARELGCHPAIVYLGHREVVKVVATHGEKVAVAQLQTLPFAIRDGEYRIDPARMGKFTVYYRDPSDGCFYVIGLKPVGNGCEVWVSTLYGSKVEKQENQRNKARLLRGQVTKQWKG